MIVNENISSIYSAGANYYFKKGEISKAQSYYEKAFDLGLYKNSDRDIYVKSLITAPLTTKSLEKMVAFLSIQLKTMQSLLLRIFCMK